MKACDPSFVFSQASYCVGDPYFFHELPRSIQRDVKLQADDLEAHYGRSYKTLAYRLLLVPHDEVLKMLIDRYGEERLEDLSSTPEVKEAIREIQSTGSVKTPPVLDEGIPKAIAFAYLGMDMPYFTVDEPFGIPVVPNIPTLDGRST